MKVEALIRTLKNLLQKFYAADVEVVQHFQHLICINVFVFKIILLSILSIRSLFP